MKIYSFKAREKNEKENSYFDLFAFARFLAVSFPLALFYSLTTFISRRKNTGAR